MSNSQKQTELTSKQLELNCAVRTDTTSAVAETHNRTVGQGDKQVNHTASLQLLGVTKHNTVISMLVPLNVKMKSG